MDERIDDARASGGEPMFDADGALSRSFLLKRGYCCGLGCRNCPYPPPKKPPPDAAGTCRH